MKQIFILLLLIISFSCRKKSERLLPAEEIEPDVELTRGLPENPAEINAVLTTMHIRKFNGNLPETKNLRIAAIFCDDKKDLLSFLNFYEANVNLATQGNITVEGLSYNGKFLSPNCGAVCYYGDINAVTSHQSFSHWKHGGNKTFPELEIKADSLVPDAQPTPFFTAVYRTNELTIDPKSYYADCDSFFVFFSYGYNAKKIRRATGRDQKIQLLPEDFDVFPGWEEFGKVIITPVKYYYLRRNGKVTVFACAASLSFNVIYRI